MLAYFKQFVNTHYKKPKYWLILVNFLLTVLLILLSNFGILPLKNIGDFLFFSFLFLFFALYRPGWAFLLFVGTIALENINLAPMNVGIMIRPYQFLGALIVLAILIRLVARRLNFKLLKLKWFDWALVAVAIFGFASALGAEDKMLAIKLSVIFSSFVILYLLARNYVRDIADLKKIIPFFLGSSVVVTLYGIWQNIWFIRGLESFEVMPGRPNGTFAEPDWLAIFLIFLLVAIYAILYKCHSERSVAQSRNLLDNFSRSLDKLEMTFIYLSLSACFVLLILTVSRSAWLGAFAATFIFLLLILTELKLNPRNWQWRQFFQILRNFAIAIICSIVIAYVFNLTNFQLLNRAKSSGTGLQKITISCVPGAEPLERVSTIEELEKFGCRHINLEDVEKEIGQNNIVKEIYRDDPNVNIRKEIYQKSWQEIKNHPLIGMGWGNIGKILGKDGRGANLNASNIFLEIWLGTGILGLIAFLAVWFYILFRAVLNRVRSTDAEEKALAVLVISGWLGLTIANLFNSGIMLGFLWLFMAVSLIDVSRTNAE